MGKRFQRLAPLEANGRAYAVRDGFQQEPLSGSVLPTTSQPAAPPTISPSPPLSTGPVPKAPAVDQTTRLATDTVLSVLQDIRQLLTDQVEEGAVWAATIQVTTTAGRQRFAPRLFSLSITNDGPSAIQYRIPDGRAVWDTLNSGDAVAVTYENPVIRSIGYQVIGGGTAASIRLKGTF